MAGYSTIVLVLGWVIAWFAVPVPWEGVAEKEASVGSKKRSAWQKQKAEFAASLGGMDDLFASENARSQRHDEERAAALRHKACERKNRYASRYEAELTAAECAEHGAPPLHVYRCPYCNGWHLTSKGE